MQTITVQEQERLGKVKPMHAVNNGPDYKFEGDQRISNLDAFREAGIPYARNHDASFYCNYGGEHVVDVHAIFPNFDADPYDERSYDFVCTDEYVKVIDYAGVKTFYRLGTKIEHWVKKFNTLPPKDFQKWAVICEHIIKHYNYGWANGFHYGMEYWEIWNEADLDPDDSTHKRTWGGTAEQFYVFFNTVLVHLKTVFPELKIGGPAIAGAYKSKWMADFLKRLTMKPDFFSWHSYAWTVDWVLSLSRLVREELDAAGLQGVESILNEWNYIQGWEGEGYIQSIKAIKGLKGASYTAGVMCGGQYAPVDMLMYYDARPCAFNGMFNTDFVNERLKGYYPFLMFNELYKKDYAVALNRDRAPNVYAAAAKNAEETAIMLTYYDFDEKEASIDVVIKLEGAAGERTAEIFLLDETHDCELVDTAKVEDTVTLTMSLFSTVLIKLK